jgi:hypothetical protein
MESNSNTVARDEGIIKATDGEGAASGGHGGADWQRKLRAACGPWLVVVRRRQDAELEQQLVQGATRTVQTTTPVEGYGGAMLGGPRPPGGAILFSPTRSGPASPTLPPGSRRCLVHGRGGVTLDLANTKSTHQSSPLPPTRAPPPAWPWPLAPGGDSSA